MIRYFALRRGINFSGKNKISMPDLKTALGEKRFLKLERGFSLVISDSGLRNVCKDRFLY